MKLLLDQNLSHRLVSEIAIAFPDSSHVREHDLSRSSDDAVWQLAKEQGFALVSKDTDFLHRALLHGHPPKVAYLRVGNCSTAHIRDLLLSHQGQIEKFAEDPTEALLVLG